MSNKLKITESQISMLQQREKDLAKRKVLKITESQYNSIFKKYDKAEKTMDKNMANLNMEDSKVEDKDINPLEFAQEIIVFIKDIVTNPRQVPFSKYWEDLDISRAELFKLLKEEGLLTKMVEGDKSTSYSTKKNGFRRGVKKVFNELNKAKRDLSEDGYISGISDPRDEPIHPPRPFSKNKSFELIDYNEQNEQLALFRRDGLLYAINGDVIPDEYIKQYADFDGIVDEEAIVAMVNEEYNKAKIGDDGELALDKLFDGHLVFVNDEVKAHLLESYGNNIKMVELLNQIPESTTGAGALDMGGPVGGRSSGLPRQKNSNVQRSPSSEMGRTINDSELLGEELARNKYSVVTNIEDNGGDASPFFDEFYQVQDYMNMLEKKGMVTGVTVRKTDENGVEKSFVCDFDGQEWAKRKKQVTEMDSGTAGGDSGGFDYAVPMGDGGNFWTAGIKQNRIKGDTDMPMVKRTIGVNENVVKGQIYSNGNGRLRIDKIVQNDITNPEISDSNTTFKVTSWGAGQKKSLNIAPSKLGGWTLQENKTFKKVLKLTETQIEMLGEVELAYPNGKYVEIDDCTKLNNNKVAQNGGCSQGDDGVVKTTTSIEA